MAPNNKSNPQTVTLPQEAITPVALEKFVENQALQLNNEAKQITFETQKDANAYNFGIKALEIQAADLKHEREYMHRRDVLIAIVTGVAALLLVILLIACLWLKEEAIVLEIVKDIVLFAGGVGGAGFFTKGQKNNPSHSEHVEPTK